MSIASLLPGAIAGLAGPAQQGARQLVGAFAEIFDQARHDVPSGDLESRNDSNDAALPADVGTGSPGTSRFAAQRALAESLSLAGDAVRIDDLQFNVKRALSTWHEQFVSRLHDAQIAIPEGITLQIRPDNGAIEVVGDVPNKVEIEQLLANAPDLADGLRQLAATHELLEAAAAHYEFAKAYERNPIAAVDQFAHLFMDARPARFTVDELKAISE